LEDKALGYCGSAVAVAGRGLSHRRRRWASLIVKISISYSHFITYRKGEQGKSVLIACLSLSLNETRRRRLELYSDNMKQQAKENNRRSAASGKPPEHARR
jgi:hypothetical protein